MDERPKRRKSKDNPYELISYTDTENKKYIIAFTDSNSQYRQIEVSEEIFNAFDRFELDDLKIMNEYDRHIEHSVLYEETIIKRMLKKVLLLEEQVEVHLRNEKLEQVIKLLSPKEQRRIVLFFYYGMKEEKIAKLEGCSQQAISKSILRSLKKIKKFLKNGL